MINISIIEFTRRVLKGGGVSFNRLTLLPVYYFQLIPSMFFELLLSMVYRWRIKRTIITTDPVFILGHYRSGTTYLQKLIASDKRFGMLTNYDALLPNANLLFGKRMQPFFQGLINIFKIKNPFFNNSIVQLEEAAEEDDYLMNKASAYSAYWGLVFPKRWREWLNGSHQMMDAGYAAGWKKEYMKMIKYATFKNKGKQLILKSPPNTERIKILLELFPKAKFIYIYRDPYYIFYSMRNMWKRAILKYYSLQKITDEELEEIIFGHFEYLIDQYEKEKRLIPAGNLIEISYEKLKEDPFFAISKIYAELDLPTFELTADVLLLQLAKEKDYRNFQYRFSDDTLKKIKKRWTKYFLLWNYET